jgi:hypothetical protein
VTTRDEPLDVRAALDLAFLAGPYFAVDEYVGDGWRPLREFVEDPAVVTDRVAAARAFLAERTGGDVELRACASVNSLGVMSRLISPALATAVLAGVVPYLTLDDVGWQPVLGGPVPVAVRAPSGTTVTTATGAAHALVTHVVDPVVRPVLERYRTQFRLSPHTLWGNVASAVAGAAGMLHRSGLTLRLDPDSVLAALLEDGPLAGAGRYERGLFVRNNCCLFYRIPAGGKCADCVLVPAVARHG